MAEEKEEGKKKKGKGKLLIIIIAVVVLAVAGVAVKMFVLGGKKKAPAKEAAHTEQQAQEEAGPVAETNLEPVVIGPIIVNLADAGGDRYLKIKLVLLEAKSGAKKAKKEEESTGMSLEDAIIRDVIINTISAKTSDDLLSVSGKEELKKELITAINRALNRNLVRKIYFTEFIIQ